MMSGDKRFTLHCKNFYREFGGDVCLHEIYALADPNNPDAMGFVKNVMENDNVMPMLCAEILLYFLEDQWQYSDDKCLVTLLVKNEIGKKNLFRLLSISTDHDIDPGIWITTDDLQEYREGLLVGWNCENNFLSKDPCVDEIEFNRETLMESKDLFNFYEVFSSSYDPYHRLCRKGCRKFNKFVEEFARDIGKPVIEVS